MRGGLVRLHAWWRIVNHDGNVQHGRVTRAVRTTDGRIATWRSGAPGRSAVPGEKGACASASQLRPERLAMR
jgi:hypothetical protein